MRDHTSWWVTKQIIFQHMSDVHPQPTQKSEPPATPPRHEYPQLMALAGCLYAREGPAPLSGFIWLFWRSGEVDLAHPVPALLRATTVHRSTWFTSHLGCRQGKKKPPSINNLAVLWIQFTRKQSCTQRVFDQSSQGWREKWFWRSFWWGWYEAANEPF